VATEYPAKCAALKQAAVHLRVAHDALAEARRYLYAAEFGGLANMLGAYEAPILQAGTTAESAAELGECER